MQRTGMGSIGTAVTGAAFFNDWSDPNGKVAMSFEVCARLLKLLLLCPLPRPRFYFLPPFPLHIHIQIKSRLIQMIYLIIRLEAWIPALATQQGKVPTTTMPTSTARMLGESQKNRNGFANF